MNLLLEDMRFTSAAAISNTATRVFAKLNDPIAMLDTYTPGKDDPYAIALTRRPRMTCAKRSFATRMRYRMR
jgi:hypothetical protein